jgi:sensitive to high expression protein 9
MRPLARSFHRPLFKSIANPSASRSLYLSKRPSSSPSICLQCKTYTQRRYFAEPPKSTTTPPELSADRPIEPILPATPTTSKNVEDVPPSDLPSVEEGRRSAATKKLSHLMDHLQGNIFIASQRINDLTGYSGIEALKTRITELENRVETAQELVRSSRTQYKNTVAERAATQREVTGLLARKDTWNPADLERFTTLYRMDHSNEQAVQDSATKLADAEREAENAASQLSSSILSRYHEEQIWSDKIRRMSTWGTWGLMGVNVLLFLVFQFGFEPWRRKRLVHGFEEKVLEALEKEKQLARSALAIPAAEDRPVDEAVVTKIPRAEEEEITSSIGTEPAVNMMVPSTDEEMPNTDAEEAAAMETVEMHKPFDFRQVKDPQVWKTAANNCKEAAEDLFSDRKISLPKKDVTIIALEGAATGAAIVAIIAALLRPTVGR